MRIEILGQKMIYVGIDTCRRAGIDAQFITERANFQIAVTGEECLEKLLPPIWFCPLLSKQGCIKCRATLSLNTLRKNRGENYWPAVAIEEFHSSGLY